MSRRKIGREEPRCTSQDATQHSSLDELMGRVGRTFVRQQLDEIHSAAKGEPAWPPLALSKGPADRGLV